MTDHVSTQDAVSILIDAADAITDRGVQRDQPNGERSMDMARTVAAFNAMFGSALTETQGWQFMALLKTARSTSGQLCMDDYTDAAAYFALAGESAARQQSDAVEALRHSAAADASIAHVQDLLERKRAAMHKPGDKL